MTDDEKYDRLVAAVERVADASSTGIHNLEQAHLGLVSQVGLLADITRRVVDRVDTIAQQQAIMQEQQYAMQEQQNAMLQRQTEQDQRFDVLLGEIRHILQRMDRGSQP